MKTEIEIFTDKTNFNNDLKIKGPSEYFRPNIKYN